MKKIKDFIKSKLDEKKPKLPPIEREIEKASLNEDRFEAVSDPLVAERVVTEDLRTFLQLYSTYPWVYIAATAIATAASSVPFQLVKGGNEVEDANEFAPYLNKPNPTMTWHELIETTFLHLELSGNAYWEVVNDGKQGNGKILAIFPLRPDRMKIIPDSKKKVKEYHYMINTANEVIKYKPEEIIHLKYTDALSEYYGVPALAAIKNEITLDFNATTWNKSFFDNGAEPGGVLQTDKSLTEQAYQRLRQNWYKRHRGKAKAHEVAILEEGLKYQQITSKHADMQYYELKAWCRDTVLAAMRVPAVIVGIQQKLSVGTERDQKKIFWHNNVIPKLNKIEHIVNSYLMPEGIKFQFVIKAIDSIVEDDQVKSTIVQSNISHGVMTINEARKKYYAMDEVEWGDTWWRPVGLVDVQNPIPVLPSPTGSPTGQGTTTGNRAGLGDPAQVGNVVPKKPAPKVNNTKKSIEEAFIDIEKIEMDEPNWDDPAAVRTYQEFSILKSHAGPDERKLRTLINKFFHEQAGRVLSNIEDTWPIQKDDAPSVDNLMDRKEEDKLLYGAIIAAMWSIYKKYGTLLTQDLQPFAASGTVLKFDTTTDFVRQWIEKHAAELVTQINDTTRQLIHNQLLAAYDNKESLQQVYERLSTVLTGDPSLWRVFKIARTELLTLTNNARLEAANQSGVAVSKRWVCALLPTSRERKGGENHVGMHNTVVKMGDKFKAPRRGGGFDYMDTPGDVNAHPENRVNCLCYVSYFHGTEEFRSPNELPDVEKKLEKAEEPKKKGRKKQNINVTVNLSEGMIKQDMKMPAMPKVDVNVENKIDVPKQDAPIVKIENKIDPTPVTIDVKASDVIAPVVKVENIVNPTPVTVENNVNPTPVTVENNVEVEKQDAPIVNVEVKPEIKAPDVNVQINPELKVQPSEEITEIIRDEKNRIVASRKEVRPKE